MGYCPIFGFAFRSARPLARVKKCEFIARWPITRACLGGIPGIYGSMGSYSHIRYHSLIHRYAIRSVTLVLIFPCSLIEMTGPLTPDRDITFRKAQEIAEKDQLILYS